MGIALKIRSWSGRVTPKRAPDSTEPGLFICGEKVDAYPPQGREANLPPARQRHGHFRAANSQGGNDEEKLRSRIGFLRGVCSDPGDHCADTSSRAENLDLARRFQGPLCFP